ncbi:MAG: CDP-alcohol phosphatidyltransferase family protein [Myxococcales bacterium]|nr:CDP-alcohol phosphatidyltransferase family protein [Myxococcales bacterium]
MEPTRLQRIRNFQSEDWYPALIVRPLTILVMLVIADWKFLTPNRLTTLANVLKFIGAYLILDPSHWILAVVFLQLGILFDHLDGTMARYRGTFTKFGSFYDKVSDMVTWTLIVFAAGWQAYRGTGEAYYILLAAGSVIALNLRGYMKWLAHAEKERLRWLEAKQDPDKVIAQRVAPFRVPLPPSRTPRDWLVWFGKQVLGVLKFEEMDLWFWLGLALVIDRLPWAIWMFAVTQIPLMTGVLLYRFWDIAKLDDQIRKLGG